MAPTVDIKIFSCTKSWEIAILVGKRIVKELHMFEIAIVESEELSSQNPTKQ